MRNRAPDDRPLTPGRRRALVRSAIGPMLYRLDAARIAAIAADCDGLDAAATLARAAAWGRACRVALDAGHPLPVALPCDASAALAAALAAPLDVEADAGELAAGAA